MAGHIWEVGQVCSYLQPLPPSTHPNPRGDSLGFLPSIPQGCRCAWVVIPKSRVISRESCTFFWLWLSYIRPTPHLQTPAHLTGIGSKECCGWLPSEARGIWVRVSEELPSSGKLIWRLSGDVLSCSLAWLSVRAGVCVSGRIQDTRPLRIWPSQPIVPGLSSTSLPVFPSTRMYAQGSHLSSLGNLLGQL